MNKKLLKRIIEELVQELEESLKDTWNSDEYSLSNYSEPSYYPVNKKQAKIRRLESAIYTFGIAS